VSAFSDLLFFFTVEIARTLCPRLERGWPKTPPGLRQERDTREELPDLYYSRARIFFVKGHAEFPPFLLFNIALVFGSLCLCSFLLYHFQSRNLPAPFISPFDTVLIPFFDDPKKSQMILFWVE